MDALEWNPTTNEPFLRLPAPFAHLILTPPRMSDVEPTVSILRDPKVAVWMGSMGPGREYTAARAESYLAKIIAETDVGVQEMKRGEHPFSTCPVRHLREERAEGGDVYLGDVGIYRASWAHVDNREERARMVAENNARQAGDPEIVWHVGFYLAPSHHGRGITTAAVKALIDWSVKWMGARRIISSTFTENHGSFRVQQKCGFVLVDTLVDHVPVGDEKWSLHLTEWTGGNDAV
ncbi:acyl-CoA N-acyltransferase [Roridomyces roridus]|uniref:Acyl-CoA N-acyltransferase n=1 Tax=Roridomyces roridus TaxID=1738132 RepID=A0AAD7BKV2_9AGAR|nr:acyl-CoA N-acyltransferase [Roridomyces roridus]